MTVFKDSNEALLINSTLTDVLEFSAVALHFKNPDFQETITAAFVALVQKHPSKAAHAIECQGLINGLLNSIAFCEVDLMEFNNRLDEVVAHLEQQERAALSN